LALIFRGFLSKNGKINPIFFQNNFEDSKYALIFASRFEKRGGSLRQVLQIKAEKNSKFFQQKFGGSKMSPIFAARSTKTGVLVKAA
jgi:hypothetical protein